VVVIAAAGVPRGEIARQTPAAGPWPSGDEIARRVNARDEGPAAARTVVMELIDKGGGTRTRATRSFRKDYDGHRRIAVFFTSPASVRGTGLLTYDYADGREDDQWLYLPALRRVRRLSATSRSESFLGSDFSYDDIKRETRIGLDDYRRTTVGLEDVDGHPCFVVEATPAGTAAAELGYSRARQWIDAAIWMPRRGDFWDAQGRPLKTIRIADIREVQGIWTPHLFEAVTHRTGHRTVLRVSDVDYSRTLDDDLFTERGLRQGL
jgi:hypothetical protein